MADLNDIYNTRIMELAAEIPRTKRLEQPQATATAHSKLCGSTAVVDVVMDGDRFSEFGADDQSLFAWPGISVSCGP